MKRASSPQWCDGCKENSAVVKCYETKEGKKSRVMYCTNKGCGYRIELPYPLEQVATYV